MYVFVFLIIFNNLTNNGASYLIKKIEINKLTRILFFTN